MNTIKKHLATSEYANFYLLSGSEDYYVSLYQKRLTNALASTDDTMNYAMFEGSNANIDEVAELAETLPFFAERRLIVLKNTEWFTEKSDYASYFESLPDTTYIIFIERKPSAKSGLYRFVKANGYVASFDKMSKEDMYKYIGNGFRKYGFTIRDSVAEMLVERANSNINLLTQEMNKLIAYCQGKDSVEREDVLAITAFPVEGQIFSMINAVSEGNKKNATRLYVELLEAHESSMRILQMLTKNYYQMALAVRMSARGIANDEIAQKLSVKPFVVQRLLGKHRNTPVGRIFAAVDYGNELEFKIKTGDMDERTAVEVYLTYLCEQKI